MLDCIYFIIKSNIIPPFCLIIPKKAEKICQDYGNKLTFTFIDNKCKLYEMIHSHTNYFFVLRMSQQYYNAKIRFRHYFVEEGFFSGIIRWKFLLKKSFFAFFLQNYWEILIFVLKYCCYIIVIFLQKYNFKPAPSLAHDKFEQRGIICKL